MAGLKAIARDAAQEIDKEARNQRRFDFMIDQIRRSLESNEVAPNIDAEMPIYDRYGVENSELFHVWHPYRASVAARLPRYWSVHRALTGAGR